MSDPRKSPFWKSQQPIVGRMLSEKGRDNYDNIFRKKELPDCAICDGLGYLFETTPRDDGQGVDYEKCICAVCDGTGKRKSK